MPAIVVIGGQWGDEGKGRIVDLMARNATVVQPFTIYTGARASARLRPAPTP